MYISCVYKVPSRDCGGLEIPGGGVASRKERTQQQTFVTRIPGMPDRYAYVL